MSDTFASIANDQRPLVAMSHAQVGLVLGLERVLREAGLVLVCVRCAADGHPQLDTNNAPTDDVWKIDCQCRRRRINRIDTAMMTTGWLLLLKDELLAPLGLDVRCPRPRCLMKPLTLKEDVTHTRLTVTCSCGNRYEFSKTKGIHKPH